MSYFNWNLVTPPPSTPTYYTYIIQPQLFPVTVGVPNQQLPILQQQYPTLQQQIPTLQQQLPSLQQQLPTLQQQLPTLQQQLPTLQHQLPTLQITDAVKYVQQDFNSSLAPSQLPGQFSAANGTNRYLKILPRNIAPKPALRRIEDASNNVQVINVKEESIDENETWNCVVKDEPEEIKASKVEDDVWMKEETEDVKGRDFDQVEIKEEKEDTDDEDNEAEDVNEKRKKKTRQKQPRRVKIFPCDHCAYSTTWKGNLTKHVISKHTSLDEINWLKCDQCPYKGKTRDYLKCHLLHVHSVKVKWFACPLCDFRAKLKCLLDRHTIINHPESTEIRWLKCDQCSYKAKFKSNLKEHVLSKHTESGDIRWFHCAHCKFKAKRKRNLRFHLLNKHTTADKIQWFQCDFCPYRMFKRRAALRKHIAIVHDGEEREMHDKMDESSTVRQEEASVTDDANVQDEDMKQEKVKPETKEIPVFIENRLCWRRVVVGSDSDDSFKCSQCNFDTADKEVFKKHILKYHVVTELKEEDDGIVRTSYKTRDVVVMMDDVPCVKRIVDHPLSHGGI